MITIQTFEELKKETEGKKVGWFMLEAKSLLESLHKGYLDCLDKLKKSNDVVVVDLVHFGAMCQSVFKNNVFVPKLDMDMEVYQRFLENHIDILLYQKPEDQVKRQFGICEKVKDMGYYKKLVDGRCKKLPYYDGWGNYTILKTYCWLYQTYPVNIHQAGNIWECGHRSFLYRHYLKKHLGIDMRIDPPARTDTGLMPRSENTYLDPELGDLLIEVRDLFYRGEDITCHPFVEDVFTLRDKTFLDGSLVEIMVNKNGKKGKLIEYLDN